jgi:Mrp family chromosome partitioning ATPase
MYVSTFYSYKGGVGRTMALANVATNLVRQGRRVLLVDFDLEAPGLDTFKQFRPRRPTPGIVEYVSDYLAMHESPDVADYVYEVILPAHTSDPASRNEAERSSPEGSGLGENGTEASGGGGRLWIMPAGRRDASYSSLLQAIDWSALYDQHDGFLMFEDLKEQWKECIGLDYVLIDSRTGHTDVAGICTRQLPNAVFLFFATQQEHRSALCYVECPRLG